MRLYQFLYPDGAEILTLHAPVISRNVNGVSVGAKMKYVDIVNGEIHQSEKKDDSYAIIMFPEPIEIDSERDKKDVEVVAKKIGLSLDSIMYLNNYKTIVLEKCSEIHIRNGFDEYRIFYSQNSGYQFCLCVRRIEPTEEELEKRAPSGLSAKGLAFANRLGGEGKDKFKDFFERNLCVKGQEAYIHLRFPVEADGFIEFVNYALLCPFKMEIRDRVYGKIHIKKTTDKPLVFREKLFEHPILFI
jgi:hypothetical protein